MKKPSVPTKRRVPDLAGQIIVNLTRKAVRRVRRREVKPLLEAAARAMTCIADGAMTAALTALDTAIEDVKTEQKRRRIR